MRITHGITDLSEQDEQFFFEMLTYVSPHILGLEKCGSEIAIECAPEHTEELRKKVGELHDMIGAKALSTQESSIRTLEDYTDRQPLNQRPIFDALVKNGDVCELCPGAFGYSGIFLKVYEYFTRKIEDFAQQAFDDIQRMEFPCLYPIEGYKRGGYFNNFPHYMMFETIMKSDMATLERLSRYDGQDAAIFAELDAAQNVLRHATCAPVYGLLENTVLAEGEGRRLLVSGRCFRNEANNAKELSRLNEFSMKEYVFVGSQDFCSAGINSARAIWQHWIDVFSLNCKVDTANDSFFANNYKMLSYFQLLGDSKQEFKWLLPFSNEYIACSSANVHRTHFSKPYNIRQNDDSLCCTSCFAFGIDRLSYALLSQKGFDPSAWDASTKAELSSYVSL
jgi:hypothetical protein